MCIRDRITDLGVFERPEGQAKFHLRELAPGVAVDEVKAKTEADVVFG